MRQLVPLVLFVLIAAAPATAPSTQPAWLITYRQEQQREYDAKLDFIKTRLAAADRQGSDLRTMMRKLALADRAKIISDGLQRVYFGDNWALDSDRLGYLKSARVIQVIDGGAMLAAVADKVVLLKGADTAGMVDGKSFSTTVPYLVTGRTQYTSAIGAVRTVFVLQPRKLDATTQPAT